MRRRREVLREPLFGAVRMEELGAPGFALIHLRVRCKSKLTLCLWEGKGTYDRARAEFINEGFFASAVVSANIPAILQASPTH
jgi:hypothetical protein